MARRSNKEKKSSFAVWLAEARASRGISQALLAEKAAVDQGYISKLENGGQPSREMVERLSKAMGDIDSTGGLLAAGFIPEIERIPFNDDTLTIARRYDNLPPARKRIVRDMIEELDQEAPRRPKNAGSELEEDDEEDIK